MLRRFALRACHRAAGGAESRVPRTRRWTFRDPERHIDPVVRDLVEGVVIVAR